MAQASFEGGISGPLRRQEQIFEHVLQQGSVAAKELAEIFDVSLMTVHRDLDELERQGLLRKMRGKVTAQPSGLFESTVGYRLRMTSREKLALARFALTQIEPGQSIIMDDSTTVLPLASLLHSRAPLTVITNFRMVLDELSGVRSINLISLGGEYSPSYDAYFGVICEQSLASLSADVSFVSTSAVSGATAYHQHQHEARVKWAMMEASDRNILLLDHTKLGKKALHRLASLEEFDLVVVDSGIDRAHLEELRECSVPVEVVPV